MSTWQTIRLGLKFVFGTFESATDYLLGIVNAYLAKTNVARKVEQTKTFLDSAVEWLTRFEQYCPSKWAADFSALVGSVRYLRETLDDGRISGAELQAGVEGVKLQYIDWMKEG